MLESTRKFDRFALCTRGLEVVEENRPGNLIVSFPISLVQCSIFATADLNAVHVYSFLTAHAYLH